MKRKERRGGGEGKIEKIKKILKGSGQQGQPHLGRLIEPVTCDKGQQQPLRSNGPSSNHRPSSLFLFDTCARLVNSQSPNPTQPNPTQAHRTPHTAHCTLRTAHTCLLHARVCMYVCLYVFIYVYVIESKPLVLFSPKQREQEHIPKNGRPPIVC